MEIRPKVIDKKKCKKMEDGSDPSEGSELVDLQSSDQSHGRPIGHGVGTLMSTNQSLTHDM